MMLAHQGGWDEILLVAGPIAVVVGLLVVATRRTRHLAPNDTPSAEGEAVTPPSDEATHPSG
jgi:hypothetical protein